MSAAQRSVELAPGRFAHASGALYLAEERTLVFADVHLGYGWALRRRRQLGPVGDDKVSAKLLSTVAEFEPDHLLFLGDLVHAPRPAPAERAAVENTIGQLAQNYAVTVVLGNHDRAFARDFPSLPVQVCREWRTRGLIAVHGDREIPEADHVLAGHIHPAFSIVDHAGASYRMPVFVAGRRITLLPAFSPLAAGWDIRNGLPDFVIGEARIVAASGTRAVDLGPRSRLPR